MFELQEYDALKKKLSSFFHKEIRLYRVKEGSQSNSYIVECGLKKYFLGIAIFHFRLESMQEVLHEYPFHIVLA